MKWRARAVSSAWQKRAEAMSGWLQEGDSILDLGAGDLILRQYLPLNCVYLSVDRKFRPDLWKVSDLNKEPVPKGDYDVIYIAGLVEYLDEPETFLKSIHGMSDRVIISMRTNLTGAERWPKNLRVENRHVLFKNLGFTIMGMETILNGTHLEETYYYLGRGEK